MKWSDRKLGDRINRGFAFIILILGGIIIIRCAVAVVQYNSDETLQFKEYPETMDEFLETSHSLGVPIELIDSTVNTAFVDGFFE